MTSIQPVGMPPISLIQPNYNAVKIDINNPQVNAPGYAQNPVAPSQPAYTAPLYKYPEASIYDVPKQSIYKNPTPEPAVVVAKPVKDAPAVPPPVIIQAPFVKTVPIKEPIAPVTPVTIQPKDKTEVEKTEVKEPVVEAKKVDVQKPEDVTPKIDVNKFIEKLASEKPEDQADAMEAIAILSQVSSEKATELLNVKVVDTLLGIMNKDTSKLEGPTAHQLEIRKSIIEGKKVSDADLAEATVATPMELAERNKVYSMFTVAILQKLYASELEKKDGVKVPITELPGAAGIVEQVKSNPNPMVRAAGIDALSYVQTPEYKQDLTTLFTVAQKDQDVHVQKAATLALEKLAQMETKTAVENKPAETPVVK